MLSWGTPLYHCENALALLANPPPSLARHIPESLRGASVELVDLRTILPWDAPGILDRVSRTGRLVVVHEAGLTLGPGAEIAARVQQDAFLRLKAPVRRVGAWDTPLGLQFEKFILPDALRILDAIVETLSY